ncbi:MAG: glycoside hydrolase family 3 C-terminal domain-containing protein [Chthoniobacterales bacterium]
MRLLAGILAALLAAVSLHASVKGSGTTATRHYPTGDQAAAIERRVEQLLGKLTEEEKISLLAGDGNDGMSTIAIPRLGIPKLVMADGPQGVRAHGSACSFPSGIALAATWDPKLAFRYGEALGREARARGIHIQLGPGVNIARTPLNGRNFEYFGEDPFLTGKLSSEWIRGLQSQGVAATVKHYAGNDTEWRRMEIESVMNEQTLREIYLHPFLKAVESGGVWSVMSAYNKLNGFPSTSNKQLQEEILKKEWGFPGLVMSDWWATDSVESIARGLDLEMPMAYRVTKESVSKALRDGRLSSERIDDAVRRLLRMAISMGFLDREQRRKDLPLDSPTNSALALEVATKSIVLLKNDPALLPLDKRKMHRVVVYGPNAQDTPAVGGGSGGVTPFRKVSFLEGIRKALPEGTEVFYAPIRARKPFSVFDFLEYGKPVPIPPRITGIRKMTSIDQPNFTRVTTSTERTIGISWGKNSPPEDVPKGREARITWDAEIEVPQGGIYELVAEGHPEIRLGDRELGNPDSYVMTLEQGSRIPLKITASEVGRGSGRVSVKIIPVAEEATGLFPAKSADAAVVCVGLTPEVEGEGFDRGFALPISQQLLIKQVCEANPRTIVVLSGGAGVDMRPWIGKVPAVLQTWYLGQEAGTALASVLFGDANPSGHLPCTFDRTIDENPAFRHYPGNFPEGKDWPVVDYHEGIFYGYRGYDRMGKTPLFPFGYGLSYTSFDLSGMEASVSGDGLQVTVIVKNTGARQGAAVLQLYLGLPEEETPRPLRQLCGFQRMELKPGESSKATIQVPADALRYWHPDQKQWVPPSGSIRVDLGLSERDIHQSVTLPPLAKPNTESAGVALPPVMP